MGQAFQTPEHNGSVEARPSLDAILQIWKTIDAQLASLSKRMPTTSRDDEQATEHSYLDTQSRLLNMASTTPARSLAEVRSKMVLWDIEAAVPPQSEPPSRTDRLLRSVLRDLTDMCAVADKN